MPAQQFKEMATKEERLAIGMLYCILLGDVRTDRNSHSCTEFSSRTNFQHRHGAGFDIPALDYQRGAKQLVKEPYKTSN